MPAQSKQMVEAIERIIVPILREKKFEGTFPHFYREKNGHVDLLSFQFHRYGGSFRVVASYEDKERKNIPPYSGKDTPVEKLTAFHCLERLHLGSWLPRSLWPLNDHWFPYKEKFFSQGNRFENAAKEVIPYLEGQAEEWWRSKS